LVGFFGPFLFFPCNLVFDFLGCYMSRSIVHFFFGQGVWKWAPAPLPQRMGRAVKKFWFFKTPPFPLYWGDQVCPQPPVFVLTRDCKVKRLLASPQISFPPRACKKFFGNLSPEGVRSFPQPLMNALLFRSQKIFRTTCSTPPRLSIPLLQCTSEGKALACPFNPIFKCTFGLPEFEPFS